MGLTNRRPKIPEPLSPAKLDALGKTQAAELVDLARKKGLHSRRERFIHWLSNLIRFRKKEPRRSP